MAPRLAPRTIVVWCADWPVVAAGHAADEAVAVLHANRVVACSSAARLEGVHRGMRRREAEARCPRLTVLQHDPAAEARAFEPVVAAVEAFAPRIEVTRPGRCALGARGPARYFGGEEAVASAIAAAVSDVLAGLGVQVAVGIADGAFAASLASRSAPTSPPPVLVIEPGTTPGFLAPLPVSALDLPAQGDVAGLLLRLGLRTLGDVAAIGEADLLARFGPEGGLAWRRANGFDDRPLEARDPPPDLAATVVFDPPAERVDTAAFAARSVAADLHDRLDGVGLACPRLRIEAVTETGEHLERVWRHEGRFTPGATAERVRWQLDGWLTARRLSGVGTPGSEDASGDDSVEGGLGGGLVSLRLVPEEVVPGGGRQLGFWGGDAEADDRASRALARVQGMLGPAGVLTAVHSGGRDPAERATLVPWGDPREPARSGGGPSPAPLLVDARPGLAVGRGDPIALGPAPAHVVAPPRRKRGMGPEAGETAVWPGRIPGPAPASVPTEPRPVQVVDAAGVTVVVSGRGLLDRAPARVAWEGRWSDITGWAGPWPVEQRWWDPAAAVRKARLQLTTADGCALLVSCAAGSWTVDAIYD